MVSDKLSVGELMTTQLTALEPVMLVSKLETVLKRCAHQAFPITNEVDKAFSASKSAAIIAHKQLGPVISSLYSKPHVRSLQSVDHNPAMKKVQSCTLSSDNHMQGCSQVALKFRQGMGGMVGYALLTVLKQVASLFAHTT